MNILNSLDAVCANAIVCSCRIGYVVVGKEEEKVEEEGRVDRQRQESSAYASDSRG
jgi:hypothetical protein